MNIDNIQTLIATFEAHAQHTEGGVESLLPDDEILKGITAENLTELAAAHHSILFNLTLG